MASGGAADDGAALPAMTGADDAASLPAAKSDEAVPPLAWNLANLALSAADYDCTPVLGDANLWPDLTVSAAAAKGKAPASSSSTRAKTTAAVAEHIPRAASTQNLGAASANRHRGRAGSGAAVEPSPMHAPNNRERRAPEQQQAPMHAPNNRSNNSNAGVRGHHQNGRFVAHPHGRGGEGYNRGGGGGEGFNRGGSRRPVVGGANNASRDDAGGLLHGNANSDASRNRGGGGWHRQEHRGGFNGGQPRGGRGYQDAHHGPPQRPFGPPMDYGEAPHHGMMHHPPPPFMGMAPPMPYPCYYAPPLPYGPYGYPYPGYFAPQQFMPEALPPFMQYPASQMHMMHANLEQHAAGPSQLEPQQQQQQHAPEQALPKHEQEQNPEHVPEQPLQAQQALPNHEQEQNPEKLRQEIRQQIEFYFSADNLKTDKYLREHMDNQGWVPMTLIAGFYLICSKTKDMEFILDAILPSSEVEVQGGRIRKRVGWEEYPLPPNN